MEGRRVQLIDRWMPECGARELHRLHVDASAESTYRALLATDLARGAVTRFLLALRALPSAMRSDDGLSELRRRAAAGVDIRVLEEAGFIILDEDPPREIVLGLQGRFWTITGGVQRQDRRGFLEPIPRGVARACWNFSVAPRPGGGATLGTETRIAWSDVSTGRSFARYWWIVRPWSGLMRKQMLRAVRATAEAGPARRGARSPLEEPWNQ